MGWMTEAGRRSLPTRTGLKVPVTRGRWGRANEQTRGPGASTAHHSRPVPHRAACACGPPPTTAVWRLQVTEQTRLSRPTRTPVGLGGAASPEARATRRLRLLCRLRRSLCPARARAPPAAPRQRRRGSVDLDGTSPPWASAAHLQSRGTREPQGSTLGGRHCHHCAQEQGTDRAGTPALAPTHTGCGGHMTASPSPTAGCPLEGAAPLLLGGGDQPNAILGGFQARGHTFVQ